MEYILIVLGIVVALVGGMAMNYNGFSKSSLAWLLGGIIVFSSSIILAVKMEKEYVIVKKTITTDYLEAQDIWMPKAKKIQIIEKVYSKYSMWANKKCIIIDESIQIKCKFLEEEK